MLLLAAALVKLREKFLDSRHACIYRHPISLRATTCLKGRRRSANRWPPKQPDPLSDARQTLLDPSSWVLQTPTYPLSLSLAPVGAGGGIQEVALFLHDSREKGRGFRTAGRCCPCAQKSPLSFRSLLACWPPFFPVKGGQRSRGRGVIL